MEELPKVFKLGDYHQSMASAEYHLGPSDVESKTMQEIVDLADTQCKDLWDNLTLSYPDFQGNPLLREEVAKLYGCTKDNVLILGSQDGLFVALTCLMNYVQKQQGGTFHAIYTYPCYQALAEPLTTNNKCETDRLEIRDTGSSWELSLEELKALIRPNTKLLVMNIPHSPTGYAPSESLWQDIVQICKEHGIFLLVDEIYWWLNRGEYLTPSCTLYTNAITLGGLAKSCGVPGLKIGWLCTSNKEILQMMKTLKDYTSHINSTPGEILGIITMRNKIQIEAQGRDIIEGNLVALREFLKKHDDALEFHELKAGTHSLMRLKGWALELGSGKDKGFCNTFFEEAKVSLVPASLYNYHREDYVRIGLGRKNMRQALDRLGKFLDKHRPKLL